MKQELEFITDIILDESNICNMKAEKNTLMEGIAKGSHFVIYGERNTGKTSLVKSLIIPAFKKANPTAFVLFADFMGVQSKEDLNTRMNAAFNRSFILSFPVKSRMKAILEGFRTLRPSLQLDPLQGPSLSVTTQAGKEPGFVDILLEYTNLTKISGGLIVFDEFQDIAEIPEAEALFRDALQNIPHNLPVLILGSKQHLLSQIFARPKAPFHNWGQDLEIRPLPYNEYQEYMNRRFERFGLHISSAVSKHLQDRLQRNPEAINTVCRTLIASLCGKHHEIEIEHIEPAIENTVERRTSRFEQYLSHFAPSQIKILIAISKHPSTGSLQGKDFIALVKLSSSGVAKAQRYLEQESFIHKVNGVYKLTDPLLEAYLRLAR